MRGDEGAGLTAEQLAELTEAVRRTQKTAAPFRMVATPRGSKRSLALRGHLADPQVSPGGAALVWVFDFSDSESELVQLRDEAARARGDFAALVGADRGRADADVVPRARWRAAAGQSAPMSRGRRGAAREAVVEAGIELVEPRRRADRRAGRACRPPPSKLPIERMVAATIGGQRRALRVSDLPLGDEGVAGYAVDVEEMEELARSFRAFREAQRAMLDQLSAGVAQFDAKRQLTFANQPFQRIFALSPASMLDPPPFERLLDMRARCRARARSARFSRPGGASGRRGSPPATRRKRPGRWPTAPICGSSPSRCPMAGCC